MEKEWNLRKMVGLTQNEMAQILNVSRSLYSMYELGKRDLPLASKELLAGMLAHLQNNAKTEEFIKEHFQKEIQEAEEEAIKQLLLENQRKRYLLDKKIAAATRKQDAALQKIQTLHYLKHTNEKKAGFNLIDHDQKMDQAKRKEIEASSLLFEYKIHIEILDGSKEFLQSKIS